MSDSNCQIISNVCGKKIGILKRRTAYTSGVFLDNFLHYLPTQNWWILEYWAKILEFFVVILEFFLRIPEFFSKTLEFHNLGGLFRWNLKKFYPSF